MADKIKCSYDDCYKHFKTESAMKKHKANDDIHDFYCKKCNVDCTDDTELLYHQIMSPKHMACPVCGRDFKSEGGRDRHVEIDHVPKQHITCVGCKQTFSRAGSLMSHIERNECSAIKAIHFHHQRAEKQTSKDAWEAAFEPTAGTTIISSNDIIPAGEVEPTLLDDERAFVPRDWQGRVTDLGEEHNGPYVGPGIDDRLAEHAVSRYPALISNSQQTSEVSDNAWLPKTNRSHPHIDEVDPIPDFASQMSLNLMKDFKDEDGSQATWGTSNLRPPANFNSHRPPTNSVLSIHRKVENVSSATTLNENDPPSRIQTVQSTPMPSYLSIASLWDPLSENYVCPGRNCGKRFASIPAFENHLHTDRAHVASQVTCPSCLKHFKTTAALISHAESGSRKCKVRNCLDFDRVIREATAGLMITDGYAEDGSVKFAAAEVEDW